MALVEGVRKVQLLRFTADFELPPYIPGFTSETRREVLAEAVWDQDEIVLQMDLRENDYAFRFGADPEHLTDLALASGAAINPEKVGCMVGEMLGVFATGNGTDSSNTAAFDWVDFV